MLNQSEFALQALSEASSFDAWANAGLTSFDETAFRCDCPLCNGAGFSEADPIVDGPQSGAPPSFSLSQIITQLRTSWGGTFEGDTYPVSGTSISYAILTSAPNDSSSENGGWQAMTSLMAARAAEAFELWDDLVPLNLTPYSGNPPAGAFVIQFGYSSATSGGGTYERPELGYYQGTNEFGGDRWDIVRSEIWLNTSWSTHSAGSPINQAGYGYYGGYGLITYLHEIGHALGLSHPGSYNAGAGSPTYANSAEYLQDTRRYSIMSYWNAYEDGSGTDHYGSNGQLKYAQTPMLHDIAAMQLMYGADTTTRTGNTVYGFNSTAGKDVYDFTKNTNPILTIYDAGGTDTIDLSGFSSAQRLDLAAGAYSDVGGYMTYNLAIAFSATIENGTGGSGNDSITGNAASNTLTGGGGNDSLSGLGADDTLVGDAGADTMYGGDGNDTLDGGAGDDFMRGGTGNDTYTVHNALDNVAEVAGEGTDTVTSLIDWTLGDNFEFLNLAGAASLGVGNAAANEINGNTASNWLDGKGGADTMRGGAGDDTYVFETLGDYAHEAAGDGLDTVILITAFDYTLTANVERLWLGGSGDYQANGNDLDNEILGNAGSNILNGSTGADTMYGGQGNDLYIIDNAGDVVSEAGNEGTDTVNSLIDYTLNVNVENLNIIGTGNINAYGSNIDNVVNGNGANNTLTGEAGNDQLNGGAGSDDLVGGSGTDTLSGGNDADRLEGGVGNDTLNGGAGDDLFVFGPGSGHDTIQEFAAGAGTDDRIDLSQYDFADFAAVLSATNDVGGSAVITLSGADDIILSGVLRAQLNGNDFIL